MTPNKITTTAKKQTILPNYHKNINLIPGASPKAIAAPAHYNFAIFYTINQWNFTIFDILKIH